MDYDQLLNDFLDGIPLEYPAEQHLFAALQTSEQLRNDLRGSILTLRAATLDVAAGAPPAHITDNIFNALGYDDAPTGARRLLPYPFGTVSGFVAGLVVAFFLFAQFPARESTVARNGLRSTAKSGTALTPDASSPAAMGPHHTERNADARGVNGRYSPPGPMSAHRVVGVQNTSAAAHGALAPSTNERAFANGAEVERLERRLGAALTALRRLRRPAIPPASASNGPAILAQTAAPIDAAPEPRSVPATPDSVPTMRAERAYAHTQQPAVPLDDPLGAEPPRKPTLPLSVELRGIASTDIRTVPSQLRIGTVPLEQNTSIGVYYHVDEGDWVGVETGQEAYYQRFEDRDVSGNIIQREQDPTLRWFGVGYKRIIETPTGLRPFAHAIVGGTLLGPAGRIALGTYYHINPALSVFGSLELSATTFVHGSTWGASPKYGFSYGLSLTY